MFDGKRFIEDKGEAEQIIARDQLKSMISYAETNEFRRSALLRYFGESFSSADCTARAAPSNIIRNPSPAVSISVPR